MIVINMVELILKIIIIVYLEDLLIKNIQLLNLAIHLIIQMPILFNHP